MKTLLLIFALATHCIGANFYASTAGSGSTCSLASPCSLRTALANQANMAPGDTLYVRGGTYTGRFISTLDGGTVRPYPGEVAKIDGYATTTLTGNINDLVTTIDVGSTVGMFPSLVLTIDTEDVMIGSVVDADTVTVTRDWNGTTPASHTAGATVYHKAAYVLTVTGTNTTYRDLEVFSSSTFRSHQDSWTAQTGGIGITVIGGDSNNIINNVIHDTEGGIFTGSSSSNTLVYGNIAFNNGYISFDGGPGGMGIYAENVSGYSRVYRNLFLNSFNGNGQFGGDGAAYTGGDHQYNAFANSGAPAAALTVNYLGRAEFLPLTVTNNHFFRPHTSAGGSTSLFGYGEAISALTLSNNYFVGGAPSCVFLNIDTITGSGNNFFLNDNDFGDAQLFYTPALLPTGTFNNNTYHKAQGLDAFGVQGVGYVNFATYKSNTGFDAASTQTAIDMPDTVVVIPNEYEAGRANIVIYATSNPGSINVNLSTTGLVNGQAYTIRNAFDYYDTAVATGTYNSASPTISVSLSGAITNVAVPTGGPVTPATTVPDFAALVVVPGQVIGKVKIKGVKVRGSRF
jgi:parallel beta-helix repeat protein